MLIATLPPTYHAALSEDIASHPLVDVLRYNIGMDSPYSPRETLLLVKELCDRFGKKLWLDLKGRQLHVTEWVTPGYSEIKLDHEVEIEGSARIHFRGSGWTEVKYASGNTVYVDPLPPQALGKGQSVNIVGENVTIKDKGYLTDIDREYAAAATELGVDGVLLSFVEQMPDIEELSGTAGWDRVILKFESAKGLKFAEEFYTTYSTLLPDCNIFPMLARDDLLNELGSPVAVIEAAYKLIQLHPEAIAASRLWSGLEQTGEATVADFADWHLLRQQGYKHFMLSDGLCLKHFSDAIAAIEEYNRLLPI